MVVSNRVLILLLIFALISSFLSILVNLSFLDSLRTTGKSSDQGFVNLEIVPRLSITTIDGESIDFGNCMLLGRDFNISSDGLRDTFESCVNYSVTNISARNDGNLQAIVAVKVDVVGASRGGSFLSSPSNSSDISYKVSNSGRLNNSGGCLEGLGPSVYSPFLVADDEYPVCDILDFDIFGGNNSVVTNFEILIPEDVSIGFSEVVITFVADEYV